MLPAEHSRLLTACDWADASTVALLAPRAPLHLLTEAAHAAAWGPGWHEENKRLAWKDPTAGSRVQEVLAHLVQAAGSADLRDVNGLTPLLSAAQSFHPLLVLAWVEAGASLDARAPDGTDVLHALVSDAARLRSRAQGLDVWGRHWCRTALALIERGADPWVRNAQGATVVDRLIVAGGTLGPDPEASEERARLEQRFALAHATWMERSSPPAASSRPVLRF